jgi:hypothetical protein
MRSLLPLFAAGAVLLAATPIDGQQHRTIGTDMTLDEVRAVLGPPQVVREADGWTYFFYTNRCLPRCGTDDTVFFREGRVVTAVLHSPARRYSGPPAPHAIAALPQTPAREARPQAGATVTGIRVRTSEPAEESPVNLGVIRGRMVDTSRPEAAASPAADAAVDASVAPEASTPAERRTREAGIEPNTLRRPLRE